MVKPKAFGVRVVSTLEVAAASDFAGAAVARTRSATRLVVARLRAQPVKQQQRNEDVEMQGCSGGSHVVVPHVWVAAAPHGC